uniref:Uncharacterized protein n=1 Tax=Pectobacterium versatile TaxID=2488639 RepID=A0A855M8Z6_9GAMM|nr:hypothetical protein F131LOC_03373 [Pectobacterium versatile]
MSVGVHIIPLALKVSKGKKWKLLIASKVIRSILTRDLLYFLLQFWPEDGCNLCLNLAPDFYSVQLARFVEAFMCFGNGESIVICPIHKRHHRL